MTYEGLLIQNLAQARAAILAAAGRPDASPVIRREARLIETMWPVATPPTASEVAAIVAVQDAEARVRAEVGR